MSAHLRLRIGFSSQHDQGQVYGCLKKCLLNRPPLQTNHHREVAVELLRGVIPRSWLQYKVSGDMTAALWVADFARRVQQLERVVRDVLY